MADPQDTDVPWQIEDDGCPDPDCTCPDSMAAELADDDE